MSTTFQRHRVDLTASFGYAFVRAFFELDVQGDELDPAAVTKLLRIEPTRSYRKGDEHPKRKTIYSTGAWTLSSGEVRLDPSYGEEEFTRWLRSIPAPGSAFRKLGQRFQVTLRVILYAQAYNSEFYFSPEAISLLKDRGLRVMLDTYLCHDAIPRRA